MKKPILFLCFLFSCVLIFLGCSKDEDSFYEESELSIDSQIPLTRSSGEGGNPQIYDPRAIPEYEDECALYTLAKLKGNFHEGFPAHKFYEDMKEYAQKEFGYQGGKMNVDVMLKVGQHFNLLSDCTKFNDENSTMTPTQYFTEGNQPKTIVIEGHTAKFVSYNKKTNQVKYRDANGNVSVDAEKVLGVMF